MNKKDTSLALFNEKQVRRHWNEEKELWYFSVVDVIAILAENKRSRKYWNDLKENLYYVSCYVASTHQMTQVI